MSNCDCPDCTGRWPRLLAWLDAEPGPWLTLITYGLVALSCLGGLVFLGGMIWRPGP